MQLDGIFGKYKPNVIRSASQLAHTLRCKYQAKFVALCVLFAPCSYVFVFDFFVRLSFWLIYYCYQLSGE